MSITVRNKITLQHEIIECQLGIKMSNDILDTIKEFSHRKQLNKTFIDALEAKGFHAWINKDKWSTKLNMRKRIEDENYTISSNKYVEIYIYRSEILQKNPIVWDDVVKEIAKYDYAGRLIKAQERLAIIEEETIAFEKFVNYVETQNFECFDLWRVKSDLKEALQNAKKNR